MHYVWTILRKTRLTITFWFSPDLVFPEADRDRRSPVLGFSFLKPQLTGLFISRYIDVYALDHRQQDQNRV
jgi:hypothetical protein